jgi:hypothetical protein
MFCCVAGVAWLMAPASAGQAQTGGSFETEDRPEPVSPEPAKPAPVRSAPAQAAPTRPAPVSPGQETEARAEDEIYILKDVKKPEPQEPKLDLGKFGEQGKLSIEKMRGPDAVSADEEGRPRGGAGVRLRIPLGNQQK